MLSDSELSAMVAQRVMGWTRNGPADRWRDPNGGSFFHESFWPPSYATDHGLALEAALKVGFSVQVTQWEPGTVVARVNEGSYENRTEFATGTTVARALCLAALRASGVEVEDDGKEES